MNHFYCLPNTTPWPWRIRQQWHTRNNRPSNDNKKCDPDYRH